MERRTSHCSPIAVFDKGRFVSHTRLVVAVLTLSVAVLSTACETNEWELYTNLDTQMALLIQCFTWQGHKEPLEKPTEKESRSLS